MKRSLLSDSDIKLNKRPKNSKKTYKFVDLYCGSGGISVGFESEGFEVLLGIDFNADAIKTYKENFTTANVAVMDVSTLDRDTLYLMSGLKNDEQLDIMVAGPPCQGFSRQNKNREFESEREGGSRNEQVVSTAKLISEVKPKMFLLENVPNLNSNQGREYLALFAEILSDYKMNGQVVNAADYGVPQIRKRYIIIGVRKDLGVIYHMPEKLFDVNTYRTVRHAFTGLPEPPSDESEHPEFPNHALKKLSKENVNRLKCIPAGGGYKDLPYEMMYDCQKKKSDSSDSEVKKGGGWSDVFGRLDWSKPANTITTGCCSISKGRFSHPVKNRGITMREAARLQSYPDEFVFKGSRKSVAKQIGNSVPPLLAASLARAVKETLDTIK